MITIPLGPTPSFEHATQPTHPDYDRLALAECQRYLKGLNVYWRSVWAMPLPFELQIVVRTTETTRYMEVAAICSTDFQVRAAQELLSSLPEFWEDLV